MLDEEWDKVFKNARLFWWSVECSDYSNFTRSTSSWFCSSLWFSFSDIRSIRLSIWIIIVVGSSNIIVDIDNTNLDWFHIIIVIVSIYIILIASCIISIVLNETSNERYKEESSHQDVEQNDQDPDCSEFRWIIFRDLFVWPNEVTEMGWSVDSVLTIKTCLIIAVFDFIKIEHLDDTIYKILALFSISVELDCAANVWSNI